MRYISFIICFVYSIISISQTIVNPVFDRIGNVGFRVEKIEFTNDATVLSCSCVLEGGSWADFSPNAYLEDVVTGKQYKILKCEGLPFSPEKKVFIEDARCNIILTFPAIQISSKLNLIENAFSETAFNVWGLSTSESFNQKYTLGQCQLFNLQSEFYKELNDTIRAIEYKEKEIDAKKYNYGITSDAAFFAFYDKSNLYDYYGFCQDTIDCPEELIKIAEQTGESPVFLLFQKSISYMKKGYNAKAIMYAKESVQLSMAINDNKMSETTNRFLAFLYYINNDYEQLEKTMSETIDSLKVKIINEFVGMTKEQRQRIWKDDGAYLNSFNSIIKAKEITGSTIAKVYDNVLFSKSIMFDTYTQESLLQHLQVSWKTIQKKLLDNDIAIEFVCVPTIGYPSDMTRDEIESDTSYYALVIDNVCQYPKLIPLCGESKIDKLWLYYRNNDTNSAQDLALECLWKPILSLFKHVKNIYFCPDGLLHILPIENLIKDKDSFGDRNNNYFRLSSTKKLIEKQSAPQIHNAVLFGNLDYNQFIELQNDEGATHSTSLIRGILDRGGFEPLYYSQIEVNEIADILKNRNVSTQIYLGEKGTEDCFNQYCDKSISIIHLATHGMYINPVEINSIKADNNFTFLETIPNERSIWDSINWEDIYMTHSFLVMAGGNKHISRDFIQNDKNDGILTAKEISQMNFQEVELVVLSACETALGDIGWDGLFGLQRGFKKAGANTILMSLDKVDDEATKVLMVEFYKNLMSGKTKLQSLKAAQNYLRKYENGKFDDPKYWASFIMLDGLN